ncbi:MAG: serine hydrolase domain-containing protein, partial [Thermomicrobiales bacterium]
LMEERVFAPIGMDSATFDPAVVAANPNHASPHARALDGSLTPLPISGESVVLPVQPAGGAWMTIGDLAAYLQTELAHGIAPDGARAVSAAELERTWAPLTPISETSSYGLGWSRRNWNGEEKALVLHDGGSFGFTARVAFLPDENFGVAIMLDAADGRPFVEAVSSRALELAFDLPATAGDLFASQLADAANQRAFFTGDNAPADAARLAGWLGNWTNPDFGALSLEDHDGAAILRSGDTETALIPSPIPGHHTGDFLTSTPPAAGIWVTLTEQNGERVILLHDLTSDRVVQYTRS